MKHPTEAVSILERMAFNGSHYLSALQDQLKDYDKIMNGEIDTTNNEETESESNIGE